MAADAPDEMATSPRLEGMNEIVERFNETHSGIHVTHSGFSGLAYEQATKTAFAGGAVPDFLQTDAGRSCCRRRWDAAHPPHARVKPRPAYGSL